MAREFRHALDDILDTINGIQRAVAEKSLSDYRDEWVLKHAVQRGIEIISEASRALPEEVIALRPEILECARSATCYATNTKACPTGSSGEWLSTNCQS